MEYQFRQAKPEDAPQIWTILQQAIQRRKADGSKQWQDGYPNLQVIQSDIDKGYGFVLVVQDKIIGYSAVMLNNEPAYNDIEGQWLTTGDFIVIHRIAIDEQELGKGYAKIIMQAIEDHARSIGVYSVKADANFDNPGMLSIFTKMGYQYCGEVYFRGSPRKAFEKVLNK
jgi:GNAT superfamily N-acetyltransferase